MQLLKVRVKASVENIVYCRYEKRRGMMSECIHENIFKSLRVQHDPPSVPHRHYFCPQCPHLSTTLVPVYGGLVYYSGKPVESTMAHPCKDGLKIAPCMVEDTPEGWIKHRAECHKTLWGTEPDMDKLWREEFEPPPNLQVNYCKLGHWYIPSGLTKKEARKYDYVELIEEPTP